MSTKQPEQDIPNIQKPDPNVIQSSMEDMASQVDENRKKQGKPKKQKTQKPAVPQDPEPVPEGETNKEKIARLERENKRLTDEAIARNRRGLGPARELEKETGIFTPRKDDVKTVHGWYERELKDGMKLRLRPGDDIAKKIVQHNKLNNPDYRNTEKLGSRFPTVR